MTSVTDRLDKYRELDDLIKPLYDAPASGKFLRSVFNTHVNNPLQYDDYIDVVGDCILGFYKTSELPSRFQSELMIGADSAQRMTSALLEFLSPVIEREEAESNIKQEEIAKLAETFKNAGRAEAEAEAETSAGQPEDIQPLRTMAGDMNRVHGYGAYRDQNPLPEEAPPVAASQQDELLINNAPQTTNVSTLPPTPMEPVTEVRPEINQLETSPEPTVTTALAGWPTAPTATQTPPSPPTEADGSVRIPINSPLKSPDSQPKPGKTE